MKLKIAYLPTGDYNFASSRLRVWKIIPHLSDCIPQVFGRETPAEVLATLGETHDVIVVQKRTDLTPYIFSWQDQGAKVVFDCDDLIDNIPFDMVDLVTTDTKFKQEKMWGKPGRNNIRVIPDCLDITDLAIKKTNHRETLKTVVVCLNRDNVYHVQNLAMACHSLKVDLTVITDLQNNSFVYDYGVHGVQWHVSNVNQEMIKYDIAACPFVFDSPQSHSRNWIESKSANKLLKAWGLGLPVIGTPIPSYLEAGLITSAETVEEWAAALIIFDSKKLREADAERGREIAMHYKAKDMAYGWESVFKSLCNR